MQHIQALAVSLIVLAGTSLSQAQDFMPSALAVGWHTEGNGAATACSPAAGSGQVCNMPGYAHLNENQPKHRYVIDNTKTVWASGIASTAHAAAAEAVRSVNGRIFVDSAGLVFSDLTINQDQGITSGPLSPVPMGWNKFVRFDCDFSLDTDERFEDADGDPAAATSDLGSVRRCLAPTVRVDTGSYASWVVSWTSNPATQQQAINRLYTYIYATATGLPASFDNDACSVNAPNAVTAASPCDFSGLSIARTCTGKYVDLHNWAGDTSTELGGIALIGDLQCPVADKSPNLLGWYSGTGFPYSATAKCGNGSWASACNVPVDNVIRPRVVGTVTGSMPISGTSIRTLFEQTIVEFCAFATSRGWDCQPGVTGDASVDLIRAGSVFSLFPGEMHPLTLMSTTSVEEGTLKRWDGCDMKVDTNQIGALMAGYTGAEVNQYAKNALLHQLYHCVGAGDSVGLGLSNPMRNSVPDPIAASVPLAPPPISTF